MTFTWRMTAIAAAALGLSSAAEAQTTLKA
jgi:hypothetical protein